MKERPIIFTGESVRAILDGRKTMTRRVIKPQPSGFSVWWKKLRWATEQHFRNGSLAHCPYGSPGDRLWVKETFAVENSFECGPYDPPFPDRPINRHGDETSGEWWEQCHYRATDEEPALGCSHDRCDGGPCMRPWHPSIFMPRWASRITLEITGVRVERVQETSEEDAAAEGCEGRWTCVNPSTGTYAMEKRAQYEFHDLWNSLNAKRGYGWDRNPWVWVISFRRVS